jgi:hypothetical protein
VTDATAAPEAADRSVVHTEGAWTRFWFAPIPVTGLAALRVFGGLLFAFWLLSFAGHQVELFSQNGWIDTEALREMNAQPDLAPAPIGWSMLHLAGDNVGLFQTMYWGSIVVFFLFALGVATRITGVLSWIIVVSFFANPVTRYVGDYLLGILAFYLMLGHLLTGWWNGNLAPVERFLGSRHDFVFSAWLFPRTEPLPWSSGANFALRIFQIHFVIIIVTSGLHKLQIADWWAGVALWYPLHPTFKTTLEGLQREGQNTEWTLTYLSLGNYFVLAWQLGLPFFAWRGGWCRLLLLGGAAIGWAGAYFLFGLPLFGPFTVIGALSFLRPEEWDWASNQVRSVFAKSAQAAETSEPKKAAVSTAKTAIKK